MTSTKKIIIILSFILLTTFIKNYFPASSIIFNNWFISPFVYGLMAFLTYKLLSKNIRNKAAKDQAKTVFILTFIYLILFILLGLIVDFVSNPFFGNFSATARNLFKMVPIVIAGELIRYKLVSNCPKKKIFFVMIVISFFLWDLNFSGITTRFTEVEFIVNEFAIAILIQSVLTYIAYVCGLRAILINRLLILLVFHFTPVMPDVDWFFQGMYDLIMYVIFALVISFEAISLNREVRRSVVKKSNPFIYVILLSLLIVLICFQLGFFVYEPLGIVTNSMAPVFRRGDAVIVRKLQPEDIPNLQIDDIIEYTLGNRSVVHRIIEIDDADEENIIFITKGDNNNGPDAFPVEAHQVRSLVMFSIPYIGYPSVYFIEHFDTGDRPEVEFGE